MRSGSCPATVRPAWAEPETPRHCHNLKGPSSREVEVIWMKKLLMLLFFLPVLLAGPALAQQEASVGEVVVTATRLQEPEAETTSDVVVITAEDIEALNVQFVSDVLRMVPELNLVQNGGKGSLAAVMLRGGATSQTLLMIDGVKVKEALSGIFDFSSITVDDIERIEIVKGPQSTIYGSDAMAGVINIITKRGKGKPKISLRLETGSLGTYSPSVTASGSLGAFDFRLSGSYYRTDGISAAKSGSEKDEYRNATVSAKVGLEVAENAEIVFTGKFAWSRSELDGFNFVARRAEDDLNYVKHARSALASARGKLYLLENWEQVLTLSGTWDAIISRDPDTAWNNSDLLTSIKTVDWQHNLYLSEPYTLTLGAEYRREDGENRGTLQGSLINRALYLNNKLKLDALTLNAGLRRDQHEMFGDKITWRAGAVYDLAQAGLRLRASYGTGFRAPTFNELLYPFYGDPALKPEESRGWEAGVEMDITRRATVSLTYFHQDYENMIATDPSTWLAANIATVSIRGVEAAATVRIVSGLSAELGYTHLEAEDGTTGQSLHLRPRDKLGLTLMFANDVLSATASFLYVGERLDTLINRELEPYTLVNLSGTYKLSRNISLFARVENLFDADYEEVGTYGAYGRTLFGGVKVTN